MKNNSILFFLPALQFNEIEFLVVKKKLENAGLNVFIASDAVNVCTGSFNLKVKADINLFNIHETNFAGIVFIGGAGARNYWLNNNLYRIVNRFTKAGKITAAICSAAVILAKAGVLNDITATCFPDDSMELINLKINYINMPVVCAENIITARNPEASSQFADAIIQKVLVQ